MWTHLPNEVINFKQQLFATSLFSSSFSRAANAILGKVGGRAPEDVILELIRSKCLPALLYGLEACSLRK